MTPGLTTMVQRPGLEVPTTIFLADGSVIQPDEAGRISVGLRDAHALFGAGWIEVSGPYRMTTQPSGMLMLDPGTGDVFQLGGTP